MKTKRVAVVGAGVAGVAAALRLVRSGHAVTVYEQSERAGGALRSDVLEGVVVDCGVQLLSSTYRTFLGLVREVGAGDRLERTPGRDALWRDGRAHSMTYGSVASMAVSSALPALVKLKVASKYLPFLATRCRHLDANDMTGTGGSAHDGVSIAEWGEAELGHAFVELMAYPFLGAYYGAEPENTSAAFYHALARVGMDVKLYGLAGGMGVFGTLAVDRLREAGAEVRQGVPVASIHWTVENVTVSGGGTEDDFEAAVLAVPASECARLMEEAPEPGSWLGEARTTPATALALVVSRRLGVDHFGVAIPRVEPEGRMVVAACVESGKASAMVPAGRDLIVAFPAPAVAAEMAAAPAPEVVNRMLPALEAVLGPLEASVVAAKVYRQARGYTAFRPGYIRHLATYDPDRMPARIALAGDWLVAPTVEGAAVSGERAAVRIEQLTAGTS